MKQKTENFDTAWQEIQQIHQTLQNNTDLSVVELTKLHKKATELVEFCRNELRKLQESLNID
ncbi:MAG: exodeoxyribonuclease VII small subunit [Saprospiraceae bacterium]|nr:exodeoxyribonuclease VII small subunit [Saprospiraceae bacterium]